MVQWTVDMEIALLRAICSARPVVDSSFDLQGLESLMYAFSSVWKEEDDDEELSPSERGGKFSLPSDDFESLITETRKGSPTPSNAKTAPGISTPNDSDVESETNTPSTFDIDEEGGDDEFWKLLPHQLQGIPERRERRGRKPKMPPPPVPQSADGEGDAPSPESTTTFGEGENTEEERPIKRQKLLAAAVSAALDGPSSPDASMATPKVSKGRGRPRLNRDVNTPSGTPTGPGGGTSSGTVGSRTVSKAAKDRETKEEPVAAAVARRTRSSIKKR
ncbi:hypothetical protein BC829DRAFT_406885 [Chytridium lagenaria]|nr:hypothetical protein BC829DRAFT_406885 [Chytridium lagenaria]